MTNKINPAIFGTYLKEAPTKIKVLATTCLLLIILSISVVYLYMTDINALEKLEQNRIDNIQELKWNFIEGILYENLDKANSNAKILSDKIYSDTLKAYASDMSNLKYDLDNVSSDSRFSKIVGKELELSYINVKNDNNDAFIALPSGIYGDKSISRSSTGNPRTWDSEISLHKNPELSEKAVNALINRKNGIIFWEILASKNPNHRIITRMDISELKKVYENEGLEGLSTYEFLVPRYITETGDIFGTADVDNIGYRTSNYKLIIVQGFSLTDQIYKTHGRFFMLFDIYTANIRSWATTQRENKQVVLFLLLSLILSSFLAIATLQNTLSTEIVNITKNESPTPNEEDDNNGKSATGNSTIVP